MKIHQAKSVGKMMLIIFFLDECGTIYRCVVPYTSQGQKWTIYCEVLKSLFTHIVKKRLELKKKFALHHNKVSYRQSVRHPQYKKNTRDRVTYEEKKGAHEITWKLTTHVHNSIIFSYNYFIPYRMKKYLCLVHNYHFYHKTVRSTRHENSV